MPLADPFRDTVLRFLPFLAASHLARSRTWRPMSDLAKPNRAREDAERMAGGAARQALAAGGSESGPRLTVLIMVFIHSTVLGCAGTCLRSNSCRVSSNKLAGRVIKQGRNSRVRSYVHLCMNSEYGVICWCRFYQSVYTNVYVLALCTIAITALIPSVSPPTR